MCDSHQFGRQQALSLLWEWTQSESLRKHALAVEACVVGYGESEADRLAMTGEAREALLNLYATTALLHDFDYERHPSRGEHPFVGVRELERLGWPLEMRTAILGHAEYSGTPRVTHLDKVLFACDELASGGREEEDEGQGVCARRQPAGCDSGCGGTGCGSRRAHRVLY